MINILYNPKTSIFQRIETLIRTQGELPDNFVPEEREYRENELRFAPGAKEGIFGHHASGNAEESGFVETLQEYLELKPEEALKRFEEKEAADFDIFSERIPLTKELIAHAEEYNAGKVANLAYCFVCKGTKCETVKLGLSLMALFNFSDNEKVCHVLKNIGYCEEFTEYVIMNISDWEEQKKQDFYFELAKKLKGWGKIEVVEDMVADTPEKKEWILCHGCRNSILNSYLAYVCATKCDLHERLKWGNLTEEQLLGATDIIEGLLDEGPCKGISIIEEPIELMMNYLEELERHELNVYYAVRLYDIQDYFFESELEGHADVVLKAMDLLGTMDNNILSKELAENTQACLKLARAFNVDLSEPLFELMEQNFEKYYVYGYYLFRTKKLVGEFLELCEARVDASKYPKKMSDSLGLGNLGEGVLMLDMIVQYMDKYPLWGKKLVEICIQSPITRWRNMAAKTLAGWVKLLDRPLAEIDRDLYELVKTVARIECNDGTRERWEKLL